MPRERLGESAGAAALRAQLRHVYWIGGGSGAGKSTIMAARHGLRLYATDDVMRDHASRSTSQDCPFLSEFATMDMDERWVNRSPETMLETFHWFRGEGPCVEVLVMLASPPDIEGIDPPEYSGHVDLAEAVEDTSRVALGVNLESQLAVMPWCRVPGHPGDAGGLAGYQLGATAAPPGGAARSPGSS
jgi:hypothetical protein